jgi:hypothetical protein
VAAVADPTGLNPGNLTSVFDSNVMGFKVPWFECYHISITQVPSDSVIRVFLGVNLWTVAQLDTIGDWGPAQPMLLQPGEEVYVFTNSLIAVTPVPVVTAWFRYDTSFPYNPGH